MELRINLDSPTDVANAMAVLQSFLIAHRQMGMRPTTEGAEPTPAAATPAPAPVPETPTAAQPPLPFDNLPAADIAAVADLSDAALVPVRRPRGRPRKTDAPPRPATPKEAMRQPVGAALAGMPARDLAAALSAPDAEVPSEPVQSLTEPAPTKAPSPFDDPDLAALLKGSEIEPDDDAQPEGDPNDAPEATPAEGADQVEAAEAEAEEAEPIASDTPTDDDIFGGLSDPEPANATPANPYEAMTTDQLEQAWREEGRRRGVHWNRSFVAHYNVRGGAQSVKREWFIHALTNPEFFMPPKVA